MIFKKILRINILFLIPTILYSAISGVVFQDLPVNEKVLNTYGIKDSNELGLQGITVTAYPSNNSTITDSNGTWTLNVNKNSRIEFSNIPSYLQESPSANINNSSVQFIHNGSTNVTFGLHNPADFSNTVNPLYVSNLQQNGTHDTSTIQSLQTVHYESTGLNADYQTKLNNPGQGEIPQDIILMDAIGSVWAKAYQKNKKRLFIASMLQRHIGFANTPADIYVTDYSLGTPASLLGNFSLQGRIPSNGGGAINLGAVDRVSGTDYTLTIDPLTPNIDLDAYAKVGKISYGGIDIDHNTNTLWLLNLNQKAIVSLDISSDFNSLSSSEVNQYLFSNLNVPNCNGGKLRPWALKVHNNKGYIGAICDGSISKNHSDMMAYILSFNLTQPTIGLQVELSFSLDYTRELKNWQPWEDTFSYPNNQGGRRVHSQPILSDIAFDKKNNMYLSFIDRYATQVASNNYSAVSNSREIEKSYNFGELIKVCNLNGVYIKEGTQNCLQHNYTNATINEFFNDSGGDANPEASLGSLAILKGSNEILVTILDPHPETSTGTTNQDYWYTQGTETLSLLDGSIKNWYANAYTALSGLNGKANGLGDIELITEAAPIEIGDRVWLDTDANGIQNANEVGIAGVILELVCNNSTVSTAITDNNGTYIFSNNPSITSTDSHKYGITSLIENNTNQCYLRIPNITGNNKQAVLSSHILTPNNIGEGLNNNLNDSNALTDNNNAKLTILPTDIPLTGYNNHSFDIGFKPTVPIFNLGDRVWLDNNKNGIQDVNETGITTAISVNLYNNANCSGVAIANTTTNNGFYEFNNLVAGTYCLDFNVPNNYNISLANKGSNNTLDSNANTNAQITNINLTDNDNTQDVGIYIKTYNPPIIISNRYTLGDRIWLDSNRNGIQDANETGITTAIQVNLYNNTNCSGTAIRNTTTNNGFYRFSNLLAGRYCLDFDIPNDHNVSLTNQGSNNALDSNANTNAQIRNINLTANNNTQDVGIYPNASIIVVPNRYTIGDRVWLDTNRNGIQDANETGITTAISVNLYNNTNCSGTAIANTITNNGFYEFSNLLAGTYCLEFDVPNDHNVSLVNQGSNNALDSNANTNAQITNINLTANDNTQDVGVYTPNFTNVLGTTTCQEMIINDDIQNANDLNASTTIDILNNDTGSKSGQEIKFLSLNEGKNLWENSTQNINSARTLDTLTIEGEGTWSIINNQVVFTALTSFDGKIPTPVYYIIQGIDCTENTKFSNVAQITINTACYCPTYSTKSIDTLNLFSIALLILLSNIMVFILMKKEA